MGRFDDLLEDIIRRPNAGELELTLIRGLAQDLWRLERARHLSGDAHILRMEMQDEEVSESCDIKNHALHESRIHLHIKQTLQELQTIEKLLPQLDEPDDDPYEEDPDDRHPDGQGPQIVPFPEPLADAAETEETKRTRMRLNPIRISALRTG